MSAKAGMGNWLMGAATMVCVVYAVMICLWLCRRFAYPDLFEGSTPVCETCGRLLDEKSAHAECVPEGAESELTTKN